MRVEVPVFKRCCCCLPLRRGLVVWAYITLGFSVMNFVVLINILDEYRRESYTQTDDDDSPTGMIVMHSLRLILHIPDILLNMMFIYGAHTKNYKLFRIYYFSIVVITIIFFIFRITNTIWYFIRFEIEFVNSFYWIFICTVSLINLGVQTYMILLVRSEMIKLGENCEFRFLNFGVEAECRLNTGASNGRINEQEMEIPL